MLLTAGSSGPSPAPFLLVRGLLALVGGGALATRSASARRRAFVSDGLAQRPGSRAGARVVPVVFLRVVGGVLALGGPVALCAAIVMTARS
ncbi:hypothetical protein [Streptomyces griseomycini]|uniref:Uncharacterized protein n=1 Tax=Streptomyces griseomycini TaxID=66895 RepID=A0A7W7LX27_9ACTN|nr:hypothetical protein [Streptomyces griseomycini]MBB4897942.1 hypothetical protein [Streptomyces griseomycini]GGR32815.1 hypothetical protein GCM10015536_43170 [Streptomyces griseomycini]